MDVQKLLRLTGIIVSLVLLTGCPIEGDNGSDGVNCWDLNENFINDFDEDTNNDGKWTVDDCRTGSVVSQNSQVEFNHKFTCDAFASLGQHPTGCPSISHSVPLGTLTLLQDFNFQNVDTPDNGISVSDSPYLRIRTDANGDAFWSLEGAYIASRIRFPFQTVSAQCKNACDSDADCYAAWAQRAEQAGLFDCYIFYHADTLTNYWEHQCGADIPQLSLNGPQSCINSLGNGAFWWARM